MGLGECHQLAASTQVAQGESPQHVAWNLRRSKAVIHQTPAFSAGFFAPSLLYTIYFPILKITVGQTCSGRENRGRSLLRESNQAVLVLTVHWEYWHAESPTGENLTLTIPAVGLQGPPFLRVNHLQKAPLIPGRCAGGIIRRLCGAAGENQGHAHLQTPPRSARRIHLVFRVQRRPGSHRPRCCLEPGCCKVVEMATAQLRSLDT